MSGVVPLYVTYPCKKKQKGKYSCTACRAIQTFKVIILKTNEKLNRNNASVQNAWRHLL